MSLLSKRVSMYRRINIDLLKLWCCRQFSAAAKEQKHAFHEENQVSRNPDDFDDPAFFNRLKNTTNSHWLSEPSETLNRLDLDRYFRSEDTLKSFSNNLKSRAISVDVNKILKLWNTLKTQNFKDENLIKELVGLAIWLPNYTHAEALKVATTTNDEIPYIFKHGTPRDPSSVVEFQKYCQKHGLLRTDNLGNVSFHRSYYTKGLLAELESALVKFSLESVKPLGFELISVPDILYPHIIESCGMRTRGERDQVFWLDIPGSDVNVCLAGTAEMAIGGLLKDRVFKLEDLPLRLAAVSRCYRAETSSIEEERGIFRVHEFTKVEMFGVTVNETGHESNDLHNAFKAIQERNFCDLGLHFKTLEMPPTELGLSAHRKFDIEAWMPGRKMYGEVSSCSNCTDFQSRRLNIRYIDGNGKMKYVHTVNGTICAVPRTLISLIETFQDGHDNVNIPHSLEKYMNRTAKCSLDSSPIVKSKFLRTKSQQMKYTSRYRVLE